MTDVKFIQDFCNWTHWTNWFWGTITELTDTKMKINFLQVLSIICRAGSRKNWRYH